MVVPLRHTRKAETLEPRRLLAAAAAPAPSPALDTQTSVRVVVDYSLDDNHFFDTQQKKDLLQQAADSVVKWFKDELLAIAPGGGDTWEAVFDDPATGNRHVERNRTIRAGEILLFAGGRDMSDALGRGGPGGYNASGSSSWLERVGHRGQGGGPNSPEFGPWGGAITFDTNPESPWYFGQTTSGLDDRNDFLSVASHEVTHLMGFGTSDAWQQFVSRRAFTGPRALSQYDVAGASGVPLNAGADHWAEGTRDNGVEVAMDPQLTVGTRHLLTPLDSAALDDVGWSMPPQAALSAAAVGAPGPHAYSFTVTYSHYAALDDEALGVDDVSVIAPDGTGLAPASVALAGPGTARRVTYTLAAPGGSWDAADSGTYSVVLAADSVRSTTGETLAAGTLGTFVVDVADPPAAQLLEPAEPAPGASGQTFNIVYTDAVAVDPVSIDADDVVVIGPDGSTLPATSLMALDATTPSPQIIATYGVPAPGGTWGPEDDGLYTVSLRPGAVRDTSGNASPGGPIGEFEISLGAIDFDAHTPAVYTDASGDNVVVMLRGPGSGIVRFTGVRPSDATSIELHGTTAASALVIKAGVGETTTGDVTVDGPLKAMTGKTTDLTGALSASGALGKLLFRSMAGAVTAPAVRQIVCRGDFTADLTAGSIGVLKVAGALAGSDVRAADSIGRVIAGSVRDSRVFAGVAAAISTLPSSLADFVNSSAAIGTLSVRKAGTFSNTLIAAPTIGKLALGAVQTANAAPTFGVAADRVGLISGIAVGGSGALRQSRLDDPAGSITDRGFVVRVL
jgi:hypothetical protein